MSADRPEVASTGPAGVPSPASLQDVRAAIDAIDAQLVPLLLARRQWVAAAAPFKRDAGDVRAPARVAAVVDAVRAHVGRAGGDDAAANDLASIWHHLIDVMTQAEHAAWRQQQGGPAAGPPADAARLRIQARAAAAVDAEAAAAAALASIDRDGGAWLGCDVQVEGLYERAAWIAIEPLLTVWIDGATLGVAPHGAAGTACIAPLVVAGGALEGAVRDACGTWSLPLAQVSPAARAAAARGAIARHPAIGVLRRMLEAVAIDAIDAEACEQARTAFGFYGALAFDYHRFEAEAPLPDDGRRRVALVLPARVLRLHPDGRATAWTFLVDAGRAAHADGPIHPPAQMPRPRLEAEGDDLPTGGHARGVARAVERMRRGDLCSMVLSQAFRRPLPATFDMGEAFGRLRRDNPYPAMFCLNVGGERMFGASPDLQVRADGTWVETAPVCGTFRRGSDPVDDHAQGRALLMSAVDEASLSLCSDSDRNDKARVCVPGSVELRVRRRLQFFSTIIHTIDATRGRRGAGVDGFDIVVAHTTPATVTGMPKALAREAIAQIEASWRGWYAGAAVRLGVDGSCEALTMLRFARIVGGTAEVRTGGSLLADSEPDREEAETRLKAETMFRVLGGGSPRASVPPPSDALAAGWPVRWLPQGDALDALMAEALGQTGARIVARGCDDDAQVDAITVVGDARLGTDAAQQLPASTPGPTLWLNDAGLVRLQREGASLQRVDPPQFGRRLVCHPAADAAWSLPPAFDLAIHSSGRLMPSQLPAGWQVQALGDDGRVVAATHAQARAAVLLGRPDMNASLRHDAGRLLLRAALAWLASMHASTP